MRPFIMGVDLGRQSDYTAIAVIEEDFLRSSKPDMRDLMAEHEGTVTLERRWLLRHLERPAIGTPYDQVIRTIKGLVESPQLKGKVDLIVDATGVGRPVIDIMVALGLNPVPVTITGGQGMTAEKDEWGNIIGYHVPKHDLVGALQAWYSMHRLRMSTRLPLTAALEKELSTFVPKVTKANNVSYEALREGDHDDLVLAAALAMWWASFTRPWEHRRNLVESLTEEKPWRPRDYIDNKGQSDRL